jgi:hypothetical protein
MMFMAMLLLGERTPVSDAEFSEPQREAVKPLDSLPLAH